MGNAAAKEFEELPIGQATVSEEKCIDPKFTTKEEVTYVAKQKGMGHKTNYETEDGELVATAKANAFGTKSVISDSENKLLAIIKVQKGFKNESTLIYRTTPAFEGQAVVPGKESEDEEALYHFATIKTHKEIKRATSTYEIVVGETDGEPTLETLYIGKTLPTLGFRVTVETPDGVCVGKGYTKGVKQKGYMAMAANVDALALIIITQSVSPGGSAGALAGAGVY